MHFNCFSHNSTYIYFFFFFLPTHIFYHLTEALVGKNCLNFDLFFPFWFCSEEPGACSVRLGRHQHGCLHSAGFATVEELHLSTKANRECTVADAVSIWSSPYQHWGRETQGAQSAPKENDVILSEGECNHTNYRESGEDVTTAHFYSSTFGFMPTQHYVNQIWLPSGSTGASLSAKSLVCEQLSRLINKLEPLLKVTAKAVKQLGQLFTTTALWFIYSDSDFGPYPLSACPPGGLGLRRFK